MCISSLNFLVFLTFPHFYTRILIILPSALYFRKLKLPFILCLLVLGVCHFNVIFWNFGRTHSKYFSLLFKNTKGDTFSRKIIVSISGRKFRQQFIAARWWRKEDPGTTISRKKRCLQFPSCPKVARRPFPPGGHIKECTALQNSIWPSLTF